MSTANARVSLKNKLIAWTTCHQLVNGL
jgi:hypothetical protein